MTEESFNFFFSVDFNPVDTNDILVIHKIINEKNMILNNVWVN